MTGQQILNRANYLIDDEVDSTEALEVINLGLKDLGLEASFEEVITLTIEAGSQIADLPLGCLGVDEVYLDSQELEYTNKPLKESKTATGTPSRYYLTSNQIKVFPIPPATVELDLLIQRGYSSISSLSEEPTDLPEEFHMALVWWVVSAFGYYDDELGEASYAFDEYLRYRGALKTYQENRASYEGTRDIYG